MKKNSILIIDDNKKLLSSLRRYLEDNGFTVITTTNAVEGFKILNQSLPTLIILDIVLPKISGFKFLHSLRNNPKLFYLPIIILTGKSSVADRIQCYTLGCNAYLSKPFDVEELLSIIRNLITHYKNLFYSNENQERLYDTIFATQNNFNFYRTDNNFQIKYNIELTPKEQHTLNLIADGQMNKEIAKNLNVSSRHIERYVTLLLDRFGVQSRTELVRIAVEYSFFTT